jgi:hypothetical protein
VLSRFSTPDELRAVLKPFWTGPYAHRDQALDLLRAFSAAADNRAAADLALAAVAPLADCPRAAVYPLYPMNFATAAVTGRPAVFGGDRTFGAGGGQYGAHDGKEYGFRLPPGVTGAKAVVDRPAEHARVWVEGLDFRIEGGYLWLYRTVDRPDGRAWLVDASAGPDPFARVFGASAAGSTPAAYAAAARAFYGPGGLGAAEDLVVEATGVPRTPADAVVEAAGTDARGGFVATDRAAYRLPAAAALPAVGSRLLAGQWVSPSVATWRPGSPEPRPFTSLAVGREYLRVKTAAPLTFAAGRVDLVVTSTAPLSVTFALGGGSGDVAAFFNDANVGGLAAALDTRPPDERTTPTTADHLPAQVDPLDVLLAFWAQGVTVVAVASALAVAGWLAAALRQVVPPHGGVFIARV